MNAPTGRKIKSRVRQFEGKKHISILQIKNRNGLKGETPKSKTKTLKTNNKVYEFVKIKKKYVKYESTSKII